MKKIFIAILLILLIAGAWLLAKKYDLLKGTVEITNNEMPAEEKSLSSDIKAVSGPAATTIETTTVIDPVSLPGFKRL